MCIIANQLTQVRHVSIIANPLIQALHCMYNCLSVNTGTVQVYSCQSANIGTVCVHSHQLANTVSLCVYRHQSPNICVCVITNNEQCWWATEYLVIVLFCDWPQIIILLPRPSKGYNYRQVPPVQLWSFKLSKTWQFSDSYVCSVLSILILQDCPNILQKQ